MERKQVADQDVRVIHLVVCNGNWLSMIDYKELRRNYLLMEETKVLKLETDTKGHVTMLLGSDVSAGLLRRKADSATSFKG